MARTGYLSRSAFTLAEFAVVLVITALLAGGILVGQVLVHATELRSYTRQFQQHQAAMQTFYNKYDGLPGDLRNAVSFWSAAAGGAADGVDATCAALDHRSPVTGTHTCNGDGNGRVGDYPSPDNIHEVFRFWQHLANAGLVGGSYTGVPHDTDPLTFKPGENVPSTRSGTGGWMVLGLGDVTGDLMLFDGYYRNAFIVGGMTPTLSPILSGEDMASIDRKMDDGSPATGTLRSFRGASTLNCITADETAYQNASNRIGCDLVFITGF